jgi:hypothetical protein
MVKKLLKLNKAKKGTVTLETIASMISDQGIQVNLLEKRIASVESKISCLDERVEIMNVRFNSIDKRAANLEKAVEDLAMITKKGFDEVHQRITVVEKNINERFDIIEFKIIARHEREIEDLRGRLLRVESMFLKQA